MSHQKGNYGTLASQQAQHVLSGNGRMMSAAGADAINSSITFGQESSFRNLMANENLPEQYKEWIKVRSPQLTRSHAGRAISILLGLARR